MKDFGIPDCLDDSRCDSFFLYVRVISDAAKIYIDRDTRISSIKKFGYLRNIILDSAVLTIP